MSVGSRGEITRTAPVRTKRQYGEKIGQEVALWIINNANFAIAYFGTLVLADVINGVDLVVTDGVSRVRIQKIYIPFPDSGHRIPEF